MSDAYAKKGDPLTPREREVAGLIAQGKASKEIAVTLGISDKTVGTIRTLLMRKIDAHNPAQVVLYALRNGLATL